MAVYARMALILTLTGGESMLNVRSVKRRCGSGPHRSRKEHGHLPLSETGSSWTAVLPSSKMPRSNKMGKKDIIKVECPIDMLDLDILGFIDHNITVNIIKDGEIVDKKELHSSKTDRQCDQMQESSMHHIHRARTGSGLCSVR